MTDRVDVKSLNLASELCELFNNRMYTHIIDVDVSSIILGFLLACFLLGFSTYRQHSFYVLKSCFSLHLRYFVLLFLLLRFIILVLKFYMFYFH